MVFGLSSEKSSESRVDEMRELKNQVKLVELDLEKRMILLENSINSVQKAVGSIEQFESSKDAIIEIQETKKTLRELEDTGLISKLETISNSDKINAITDAVDAINEKIKLLSDAIEILSESRQDNKGAGSADPDEFLSVKSEMASLKGALSKISSSMADPQKLSEFDERITSLEGADNALNAELKKTYEAYHEKISLLERRISSVSPASGIPKEIPQDISRIKDEIEHMKGINKKLIEMIEINSRAFGDLKDLKTESSKHNALRSMVTDLSMNVADIQKEMKLERAMYPHDITNLKKDMANVKSVQKNLVETMESVAKMKQDGAGIIKLPDQQNKIKNIEKAIGDISGKITEVDSLKDKIESMNREIYSLKSGRNPGIETDSPNQKAELQKDSLPDETNKKIGLLEKSLAQVHGKINGLQALKEELEQIETRISLIEEISGKSRQYGSGPAEISDNEKALSSMVKSVAEENKILREEIEQLKQICAEILKETQQQPIIID